MSKKTRRKRPATFTAPYRCGSCGAIHIIEVPRSATGNIAHSCPITDEVVSMARLHISVDNATRKWGAV